MTAPAPIYRSQGNALFRTDPLSSSYKRGQTVPYDVNGSPAPPAGASGFLAIDINDLSSADPAKPLYEFEVVGSNVVFTGTSRITAGVAATSPTVFPVLKNGTANGNITVTGFAGVLTLSDSTYPAGSLFSLYPPTSADATLDRVRISLETA